MKCFTAFITGETATVSRGIELPFVVDENGARVYLGYPFVSKAHEGPQSAGRYCHTFYLPAKLVRNCTNQGAFQPHGFLRTGNVRLEVCEYDPGTESIQSFGGGQEDEALVLLTASTSAVEFGRQGQIGEGFLIDYRVSRGRYQARFEHRRAEQRLYRLGKGEKLSFSIIEPVARIFGIAVHKGQRRSFEICNTGDGITMEEVEVTPLTEPDFELDALSLEAGTGGLCVLFFLLCGAIAHREASLFGATMGALLGISIFLVAQIARLVVLRLNQPAYTSEVPRRG